MEHYELPLRVLTILISVLGVAAAIFNMVTSRTHAQRMAKERHDGEKLDAVVLLAARTEQRVNAIDQRQNNFENRVDRRLDQIAGDIGKVKDLFTDYLIKH